MNRRSMLTLITTAVAWLWIALATSNAVAQPAADVEGVKAASKAFYAALAVIDDGQAMDEVVAHSSYITIVGPLSRSITVRYDAWKKYWADANEQQSLRTISLSEQLIHVNGNLAYEMGQESGTLKLKDGREIKIAAIVTNVYEKIDGRWLMISHHAQAKPQ